MVVLYVLEKHMCHVASLFRLQLPQLRMSWCGQCRRGYRSDSAVHKAALNEAAAAGLMLMAGWQDTCRHKGK